MGHSIFSDVAVCVPGKIKPALVIKRLCATSYGAILTVTCFSNMQNVDAKNEGNFNACPARPGEERSPQQTLEALELVWDLRGTAPQRAGAKFVLVHAYL
jgi:hypothetical protein